MTKKKIYAILILQGILIIGLVIGLFFAGGRFSSSALPRMVEGGDLVKPHRETIADLYIRGSGIEIGALHLPAKVPPTAEVKYLDLLSNEQLEERYPELADKIVPVDIVDDGEYLRKVEDATQDFVIANHFLEHCQNPIATVENMLRVLKPGGILLASVPDKRYTFDLERPVTTFEHILKDYIDGPEWSRRQHFEEWVTLVDKVQGADVVEAKVEELMLVNYSIHYHVWRQQDLNELLVKLQKGLGFPFNIELVFQSQEFQSEVVFALKKTS